MYLKQLKIANFKSFFEPTEFCFEPGFNVLLGANSSGKTSVLEAINIREFQNTPHRSIVNVPEIDTVLVDASAAELRFAGRFDEICRQLPQGVPVYIGIGDQLGHFYSQDLPIFVQRLQTEYLWIDFKRDHLTGNFSRLSFADWPSMWRPLGNHGATFPGLQIRGMDTTALVANNFNPGPTEIDQLYGRIAPRIYKFSSERAIQTTCEFSDNELAQNCANLAFCISQLQNNDHVLADKLMELLHRVFPTIHRVKAPTNASGQFELRVQTTPTHLNRNELTVPINQVGTGVGNALAMLYVALTAQTQRFILLEEPNSFLHPRALRELLAILAEIGGKHQFFITTHSSDVLRTIKASTVTLLEYDGRQTTVRQTTDDKLHQLRAGLVDLGISLTDLHGCDKVLWVEGETEEAIFPLLLRHFFPELAQGIAVLPLHATGDFEARKFAPKKVAQIYKTLSEGSFLAPPMVAIALDTEGKPESLIRQIEIDCAGIVHFLPRPMLEDYLLDAEAIAAVLSEELRSKVSPEQVAQALSETIKGEKCLLTPLNPNNKTLHAANVLKFIFDQIAQLEYRKTAHGPKIAEWLLANKPTVFAELKEWFAKFLNKP
ncbi:MAG TPA: AAA family ATPase [Burkholderiaceae bacterium]|nr:AAA family ATPase [Burkholderiaceae bacterium]